MRFNHFSRGGGHMAVARDQAICLVRQRRGARAAAHLPSSYGGSGAAAALAAAAYLVSHQNADCIAHSAPSWYRRLRLCALRAQI